MEAELALRLRAEALIAGFGDLGIEESMGALADVEAVAAALAATGAMGVDAAGALVVDTVDALVVRGASWVEPTAVDLDVRRLYDLAAGVPRPRLRRVVPVASGALASVDLWDDRAEVRVAGGPSLHLEAVPAGDRRLELRDEAGAVVTVELDAGRAASEGGSVGRVDAGEYLSRVEVHAVSATRRDPSVDSINAQRHRLVAVAETLDDDGGVVARFDEAASGLVDEWSSRLVEVVPVAVRATFGWVLSVERWSGHWRAIVIADGRALWTAIGGRGERFGGDIIDADVVRFDPALPEDWSSVTLQRLAADGTSIDVEVRR